MTNIYMVRENGVPIPQYAIPKGFAIQALAPGEGEKWDQVMLDTGFYQQDIDGAFNRIFAPHPEEFYRILMLLDCQSGQYVGSTAAWYNSHWQGGSWGQIHWVGISKDYQGRGLAKPLMSAAMNILVSRHQRSFLETQPIRIKAIQMYLDYGFVPHILSKDEEGGWDDVVKALGKEIL